MGISFIFTLFTLLGSLLFSSFTATQTKASDVERKNDINSIYVKLEEHFNDKGDYPTLTALVQNYESELPTLDPETLIDPNGKFLQEGEYTYSPTECTALGCAHYTISAQLESEEPYIKTSLN